MYIIPYQMFKTMPNVHFYRFNAKEIKQKN